MPLPAFLVCRYARQLKEMTAPSICDKKNPNDREVRALAEVVWRVVIKKFPFLEDYRTQVRISSATSPAPMLSLLGAVRQGTTCAAV